MRALVVGCGYVGLPLGTELARLGHEVFGVRRNAVVKDKLRAAGIQPLVADITKPNELAKLPRRFDWAVNCVASRGGSVEDYRRIYLQGMWNLIEWLSTSPPQKFVYTSSTSVYGQPDGSLVEETNPTEPSAGTARILVETEKLLIKSGGSQLRSPHQKLPAVILRVAAIYGPERGHWFRQFLKNEARIQGDGSCFLNMIHRDDVVGSIIAALENGRPGEIYNAVDDEPVSQMNFFRWLAKELGKKLPLSVLEIPDESCKRGITNKRVSNRKLKVELGYQFKYPDFRSGYSPLIVEALKR